MLVLLLLARSRFLTFEVTLQMLRMQEEIIAMNNVMNQ